MVKKKEKKNRDYKFKYESFTKELILASQRHCFSPTQASNLGNISDQQYLKTTLSLARTSKISHQLVSDGNTPVLGPRDDKEPTATKGQTKAQCHKYGHYDDDRYIVLISTTPQCVD